MNTVSIIEILLNFGQTALFFCSVKGKKVTSKES